MVRSQHQYSYYCYYLGYFYSVGNLCCENTILPC